jgi:hypothetical protein
MRAGFLLTSNRSLRTKEKSNSSPRGAFNVAVLGVCGCDALLLRSGTVVVQALSRHILLPEALRLIYSNISLVLSSAV